MRRRFNQEIQAGHSTCDSSGDSKGVQTGVSNSSFKQEIQTRFKRSFRQRLHTGDSNSGCNQEIQSGESIGDSNRFGKLIGSWKTTVAEVVFTLNDSEGSHKPTGYQAKGRTGTQRLYIPAKQRTKAELRNLKTRAWVDRARHMVIETYVMQNALGNQLLEQLGQVGLAHWLAVRLNMLVQTLGFVDWRYHML